MGGQQSQLKKAEVSELIKATHFDEKELNQLFVHFNQVSVGSRIDRANFKGALGLQDNLFADRIFQLFDVNHDGSIDFREFIIGLSALGKRGTLEEKLRFSFRVYDFDGDGTIDSSELCQILKASFLQGENMTDAQIQQAVASMFAEADTDGNGRIDFAEYRTLMMKHPAIIRQFSATARSPKPSGM